MNGLTVSSWSLLIVVSHCASANAGLLDIFRAKQSAFEIIDSTGDDQQIDKIQVVADVLCQWSASSSKHSDSSLDRKQISRISTIDRLEKFFAFEQTEDDIYSLCANRYLGILRDLNLVLKTRPDNVCSEEKLTAIEKFHNNYLSVSLRAAPSAELISGRAKLHPMLASFFMYYTMEVSSICKRSVLHSLEWDLDKFHLDEDDYDLASGELAQLLAGMTDYLGPLDRISDLDDVVYLWDLLDYGLAGKIIKSTLLVDEADDDDDEKEGGASRLMNQETGSPIRLLIKVRNGGQAKRIQRKCLNRFRPIYSRVIMPVTRLSNLGYSSDLQSFRRDKWELIDNSVLRRWYSLTQICEAIMPIKFYEDSSLGPNDAIIITKNEARQLERPSEGKQSPESPALEGSDDWSRIDYEPSTNSMLGRDRLYSMDRLEWQQLVRRIKLSVDAHDRSMGRILARLLRNSLDAIRSRLLQGIVRVSSFGVSDRHNYPVAGRNLRDQLQESVGQLDREELDTRRPIMSSGEAVSAHQGPEQKALETRDQHQAELGNGIVVNLVNACLHL